MMAYDSSSTSFDIKNELPAEEFQRKLHRWFEEQGLLSDLRAHMRQLMVGALRRTQLGPRAGPSTHQNTSPKIQAVNLLVAEFLLLQECHYSLSVFTSEVPLLRNLPEFSASFKDAVKSKLSPKNSAEVSISSSKLLERHVWDILEALGFSPGSSAGETVFNCYKEADGESLLICLIRSISKVIRSEATGEKAVAEGKVCVSNSESDSSTAHNQISDAENEDNLQNKWNIDISVIHKVLQELSVKPRNVRKIESEIRRLLHKAQVKEQHNIHEKLLYHENRIREERARYEKELQGQITQAHQRLVEHCASVEAGLRSREAQVIAATERLQHRLRVAEEENNRLRILEQERQEKRAEQVATIKEKKSEFSAAIKEKKSEFSAAIKEKKSDLSAVQQEDNSADRRKSAMTVMETSSKQLKENQNDLEKTFRERSSHEDEEDTNIEEGERWYPARTPSNVELENSASSREQGVQVGKPAWQLMSDLEEVRQTLQQLQQENEDLRSLMRRQQEQVRELRAWGRVHLAASVSHSPAQTSLVVPPDPGLAPPLPPRLARAYQPPDRELSFRADGVPCVVPASTQTPVSVHSRTRRPRRFTAARAVSLSSDDTSPTEEMLQDARRRLRELEEESKAVDRSYREFCLRHTRETPVANVLTGILHGREPNGQPHSDEDPSSSDTAVGSPRTSAAAVPRPEKQSPAVTAAGQPVDTHHGTWPTVTRSSNVYLSDLVYSIPSSELVSHTSSTQHVVSTEKQSDSNYIANRMLHPEVYTTDTCNAPVLSSTVGNNLISGLKAATGDGNKAMALDAQTEETSQFNVKMLGKSVFPPDSTPKNWKAAPGPSNLNKETGRSDAQQILSTNPRNIFNPTTGPLASSDVNTDANFEVLYQKPNNVHKALERSSQTSLKTDQLPNPRLSDFILIEKCSDKTNDETQRSCEEKDVKKDQSSHNDVISIKSSLSGAEFIPATSADQLFLPSHDVGDESDFKSSVSDMVPIDNKQTSKLDQKLMQKTDNQTVSDISTSSNQQISAGNYDKSVSSNADNFW